MSRRFHGMHRSQSKLRHSLTWDFGAAKGTGASVVIDYDHHKNRTKDDTPGFYDPHELARARRERELRRGHPDQPPSLNVREVILEHDINPDEFVATACRLAEFSRDQYRPIPMEVRAAMATAIETAGGNRDVADQVRLGKLDDHLHHLVKRK